MIKDSIYRLILIPVMGIIIFLLSEPANYYSYTAREIITGSLYFSLAAFCIWQGSQSIHGRIRKLKIARHNPFFKVASVSVLTGVYACLIAGLFSLTWISLSGKEVSWEPVSRYILLSIALVFVFTLVYEIIYLSKERELADTIAGQLDDDLTRAEMTALRNALDPHFIFNSLNTLSHLITHDPSKANLFNNKLSQVYKYFLINKDKRFVPASSEICFMRNYFYLLKIRHGDKVVLSIDGDLQVYDDILIIPCALQLLVENAIKHNQFTKDHPLHINIKIEGKFLRVQNNLRKRNIKPASTGMGLRNLQAQYQLISNKSIITEKNEGGFIVKLPLLRLPKTACA